MIRSFTRSFQTSALRNLKAGDLVPTAVLYNGAPSKTINLAEKTNKGKYLIVGVPGAFSPGCSQRHIPEYIKNFAEFKDNGFQNIFVVTVNDSFVSSAWEDWLFENSEVNGSEGFLKVLADQKGEFSKEFGTLFDATPFFGNERSKRYAAIIDNGKVSKAFIEEDNTGITVSSAENVAKAI